MKDSEVVPTQADIDRAIRPYSGTAVATLAADSGRKQPAAYWRQIVAWVLIETGHGYREVAVMLRREKPTIEGAHGKIERLRATDDEVRRLTDRLAQRARERARERRDAKRGATGATDGAETGAIVT